MNQSVSINVNAPFEHANPASRLTGRFAIMPETLRTWRKRKAGRYVLRHLSPHLLVDIGISESERFIETNKPFWRA